MTRLKIATVAILAMAALASAGVVAAGARRPDAPTPPLPAPVAAPIADEPKPDASPTTTVTVEARDLATDAPVPGVRLEFRLLGGSRKIPATTDAAGTARFSHPADVRYFFVSAAREGMVSQAIRWDYQPTSPAPPDHVLFQMERATTVGGRVVDQDQKPIAGATVVIDVSKGYPKSRQWVDFKGETTRTDADGRWSFASVPEAPDAVKLTAYDHRCLTERTFYLEEKFQPLSALRDGTATLHLRRGTIIEGTVLGPDGRPAPDAEVFYGSENRRIANTIPPVKADANGRFTLGIQPGVASSLTACRAGFGPALLPIQVGSEPQHVTLRLQPARTLSGRVVDRTGKPVPLAYVVVRSWRGSGSIGQDLQTDRDGRFAWNEAPADEVQVDVGADGYSSRNRLPLVAGKPHEIVLTPPTLIKGTVVDAGTGRPIPQFSLLLGSVTSAGRRLIWQRGMGTDQEARRSVGAFEYALQHQPAHQYLMRVQAEGYLPEDSARFSPDSATHSFAFRLTRSEPIRGTVRKPDGFPADGFVYLATAEDALDLYNGDVNNPQWTIRARIAPDGRFTLPPQKGAFLLVALSDAGFVVAHGRELRGDDTLRLQPWARITGTVKIDGKPSPDIEITDDRDLPPLVEGEPRLSNQIDVETDADGRFAIPRLMPGRHILARRMSNGVDRRSWFVNMATVDVASGQTHHLKIGELGRRVTGRLAIPASGQWMVRKASIEPAASKGQPASIGVQVFNDGRLLALDLPPGEHVLRIAIHEPPPDNACGWGRLIAAYSREFKVSGNADDSPLDLGVLRPAELGGRPLRVGEAAPDFAVKTLDGKDLTLADFRGKFVLLDFWATWCAPCVAEIPNLDAIHKAFGGDPRFAMVSLSLDETPAEASTFVKSQKTAWHQGWIGPESPIATAYNATAIPATFLIGPDGRIVATDLRREKLKTAVAQALGSRKSADRASAR